MKPELTVSERVNAYITNGSPDAYCDECIAEGIGEPIIGQIGLIASTLATTESFNRSIGECAICSVVKPLTSRA